MGPIGTHPSRLPPAPVPCLLRWCLLAVSLFVAQEVGWAQRAVVVPAALDLVNVVA